jgi:hypothetical protein
MLSSVEGTLVGGLLPLLSQISNRPRVTSSCAGKLRLREAGEHTSGPNLASRDNVAQDRLYNDSGYAATDDPALSKASSDTR